jgi:hypothetical protein
VSSTICQLVGNNRQQLPTGWQTKHHSATTNWLVNKGSIQQRSHQLVSNKAVFSNNYQPVSKQCSVMQLPTGWRKYVFINAFTINWSVSKQYSVMQLPTLQRAVANPRRGT